MNEQEYFDAVTAELARELTPNLTIKKFANNTAVIGAYTEATIGRFVERVVAPLRVSTGAVIGPEICTDPASVRQIDTIIWSPLPIPAVFESGSFGLIPRMSAIGILEVKRSNYNAEVGGRLKGILDIALELTNPVEVKINGVVQHPALGVIAVRDYKIKDDTLDSLMSAGRVVHMLERTSKDDYVINSAGVFTLINFLTSLRLRAKLVDGEISIAST